MEFLPNWIFGHFGFTDEYYIVQCLVISSTIKAHLSSQPFTKRPYRNQALWITLSGLTFVVSCPATDIGGKTNTVHISPGLACTPVNLYRRLLTPTFVICSTNVHVGEGVVNSSYIVLHVPGHQVDIWRSGFGLNFLNQKCHQVCWLLTINSVPSWSMVAISNTLYLYSEECATPADVHMLSRYFTAHDEFYQTFPQQYRKQQTLGTNIHAPHTCTKSALCRLPKEFTPHIFCTLPTKV